MMLVRQPEELVFHLQKKKTAFEQPIVDSASVTSLQEDEEHLIILGCFTSMLGMVLHLLVAQDCLDIRHCKAARKIWLVSEFLQ